MRLEPRDGKAPKVALQLRLLAAIDDGRHGFEALKLKVDAERPPSTRTLRRYLAELHAAGFPWYYDRERGTYRFDDGYSLRKLELSNDDLFGLLALKSIAASLGGDIGNAVGEVADKLTRVAERAPARDDKPPVRLQMADPKLDPERAAIFRVLQAALRQRQSVRFAYVDKLGAASRRHVDPYGFVVSGGSIYLVALDRGRGAKRVFSLDGISDTALSPQRFTLPDDFDMEAFAAGSVSGTMHGGESARVKVRYSPVIARAAKADRIVRERVISEREDGSVEIEYTIADLDEFVRWAMKWGGEAEIVGPPSARERAAELARAILRRYDAPPKR